MTSKDLNLKLINMMPYLKLTLWQEGDDTGSHIVFSDVLFPYIIENIKSENNDILDKCFEIIEKIFDLCDEYADEVIIISILENLSYEKFDFDKVIPHMYDKTKKIFYEILKNKIESR